MNTSLTRVLSAVLLLVALGAPFAFSQGQTPAAPAAEPATTPPASATASSLINPAISTLQAALDDIRLEKWKTSSTVRDDTENNIASVHRDLEVTLPPLLATADAAPNSVAQVLPAFRNIEALYNVLLRVSAVGRLAAPPQQSATLEQAMSSLESSRRALGDQIQSAALNQDSQIQTLQTSLRAVPPPAPAPMPCQPASQPAKRKPRAKPKTKPVPANPTPAAPS